MNDIQFRTVCAVLAGSIALLLRAVAFVAAICQDRSNFLFEKLVSLGRIIRRDGAILAFAGVNDPAAKGADRPDLERAMAGIPPSAIKVLLSHRPQTARHASGEGVHLQLSGHTHGGQFFPFNLLIRWFQPVVRGLHKVGGTWLYVSRGTGYWGPPSRLGVGGEVTLIELTRQ